MTRKRSATPYLFLVPALIVARDLRRLPDHRGHLLQLHGLRHRRGRRSRSALENYQQLIDDPTFWLALVHSFVYLLVTPILIGLSIVLAIIVNRQLRGIHIFRALYFVPAVSGSIAIGLSWRWLFERNGLINSVLESLGVITTPIQWLATPSLTLPIAMTLTIWAGVGYYSVIFLAGLQNIPEELYDAARIDGCSDFQKHRYVSLPGLRPQIVFVAVISSLAALKVFDEIYVLTNRTGGILDSGVTMVFYLWKQAFRLGHAGYASAIAIVLLAVTLVFSVVNVRLLDRGRRPRHDPRVDGPARSSRWPGSSDERARRARRRPRAPREGRALVRAADLPRRHHGLPVLLDADDVAQGPAGPGHVGAAAVHPERPDARELREGPRRAADPEVLPEQRVRRRVGRGAQRPRRGAGRLPAREDAVPWARRDLLRCSSRRSSCRPS